MGDVVWQCDASQVAPELVAFAEACSKLPGKTIIADGARTRARAAEIYSWGRTAVNPYEGPPEFPGPNGLGSIATNAVNADQTAHGYKADGVAHGIDFDVVPSSQAAHAERGALAKSMGLAWGGDFLVGGKPDIRHVETKRWRALGPGPDPAPRVSALPLLGLAALALASTRLFK